MHNMSNVDCLRVHTSMLYTTLLLRYSGYHTFGVIKSKTYLINQHNRVLFICSSSRYILHFYITFSASVDDKSYCDMDKYLTIEKI